MKYKFHLLAAASVAAIACIGAPTALAQGTASSSPSPTAKASPAATAAASDSTTAATKPARAIPFRGTATAVDQSAKTFTIAGKSSSRVFKATDSTKITKAGEPATFADLPDNEPVTGSYRKMEDGTLELNSLKIGGKTDAEKAKSATKKSKKKKASEDEEAPTSEEE
jgi:hypothetical protein